MEKAGEDGKTVGTNGLERKQEIKRSKARANKNYGTQQAAHEGKQSERNATKCTPRRKERNIKVKQKAYDMDGTTKTRRGKQQGRQ